MCGIAGLFNAGNEQTLRNMLQVLKHRGPDNSGVWIDNDVGLCWVIRVCRSKTSLPLVLNQ